MKWSDEERWKLWIYSNQGYSRREIAVMLGRSYRSVSGMMDYMNTIYHPPSVDLPEKLRPLVSELGGI
jgi:hypothetical protein